MSAGQLDTNSIRSKCWWIDRLLQSMPACNDTSGLTRACMEIEKEPAAWGRAIVWDGVAFPEFRRRGLGRAIMQALHASLAGAGAQCIVFTATEMGIPLYEQLGYRSRAQDWIYESAKR